MKKEHAAIGMALVVWMVLTGCGPGGAAGPAPSNQAAGNAAGAAQTAGNSAGLNPGPDASGAARGGEAAGGGASNAAAGMGQGAPASQSAAMQPAVLPLSRLGVPGLSGISFVNSSTGFAAGPSGILRTQDGGRTWAQVYLAGDPVLGICATASSARTSQGGTGGGLRNGTGGTAGGLRNGTGGTGTGAPASSPVDVWAYTGKYLLVSTDGRYFSRIDVPGLGQGSITSISAVPDAGVWVAAGGSVYVSNPMNGALERRTPQGAVVSQVAALSDEAAYAADGRSVWRTTDAGRHWTKVFTARLNQEDGLGVWKPRLAAAGEDVWVMFYGGGAGMSQQAYVIYHSADGVRFTPVAYEGYFQSLYPDVHLPPNANIGAQPGPMVALGKGRAVFVGWEPRGLGDSVMLTTTADGGRTFHTDLVQTADEKAPNFFSGIDVAFPDVSHGFIAGTTADRKATVLRTDDGGRSWTPVP
ncbi:hypothetical protein [Alicyclobacillus sp.]|uniref:sialidase family protein n=1 Tax=Alicyclobacillus sp. TaxID=61169 RepID=UPI0025BA5ECD|nr:hypothetical protein [Alicyclobacillus sp.]MCL6516918.1 hypothetical protein [Alicyclobacillus sp.]